MFSDLIHTPDALWKVVLQTTALYLFLVVALRLAGRRKRGELGMLEVLMLLFLGTAVETPLIAGNRSLVAGLVSAATLLLLNAGLARLVNRSPRAAALMRGEPLVLVRNGEIVDANLQEEGLSRDDVLAGVRKRGYASLQRVRYAVLEPDGEISVIAEA